jgi:multidrug efflux pump subunit AcrA (membrane-fusion protein)
MSKRRLITGLILLLVVGSALVTGGIYLSSSEEAREQIMEQLDLQPSGNSSETLVASGFIEAEEIELAAEIGGRVAGLPFAEGDEVSAGDAVVQIDTTLLEAARMAAVARLDLAAAQRDLLLAGMPEEVIRQAEAQVELAQAALSAAEVALEDAAALRNNPQDFRVQVVEAQTQVEVARYQVEATSVQVRIAERTEQLYSDTLDLIDEIQEKYGESALRPAITFDLALSPQRREAAYIALSKSQEALANTQQLLQAIERLAYDPQVFEAQVISAQMALATAQAQLEGAQAQLDALRAGATEEELAVAAAQIAEAEAGVQAVDEQIARMTLYAPIGGLVLEQVIHVGELAVPGIPLVTLANLDRVELTVYVAASHLNQVWLTQEVWVSVDSFPSRRFAGTVIHIADEAEFTPRSVQTAEERANLVYAIRIQLENADHALKPGMPADAHFE